MININLGHNDSISEKCPKLKGYINFVYKVRKYKQSMDLGDALNRAVEDCIAEGFISDF